MKFSLLYKEPDARKSTTLGEDIIYNLQIDKVVSEFCQLQKRADYFIDTLKNAPLTVEDIIYRQEIIKDFLKNESLVDELKLLFNRYDSIKGDWNELKSNVYPAGLTGGYQALIDFTYSNLQITSTFARTIVSYFKNFHSVLGKYDISSEALCEIKRYCGEMQENESLAEIDRIASLFLYHTPDQFRFKLSISLDETLTTVSSSLTEIKNIDDLPKNNLLKKLLGLSKDSSTTIDLGSENSSDALYILNEALYEILNVLEGITNEIYELFYGISGEFLFYDAALSYIRMLENNNIPHTFPQICCIGSDSFYAKDLKDLFLLLRSDDSNTVIGNDVEFSDNEGGILIRGKNNTGKTVFLRSIGIAQIFAQSGLPVCSTEATISIRKQVFSHFSSAEEELIEGDVAGRFESEVKEVASIVNNIEPHSLVLFNETFQTTSYDEGKDAIYTILLLLTKINSQFIFVTHLTGLFDSMMGGVKMLETDSDENKYKLKPF